MKRPYKYLPFLILATICSCNRSLGPFRDRVEINGTIIDGCYDPPHGKFSVKVPELLSPGSEIVDQVDDLGGTVSFRDGGGTLVRIDYFHLSVDEQKELQDIGLRRFITKAQDHSVYVYTRSVSGSRMIHQEFLTLDGRECDLFVMDLPKGATLAALQIKKPLDAQRANLIFLVSNSLYMLSTQRVEVDQPEQDAAIKEMKKEIISIYNTMSFKSE